jgi:hypothetical protein
LWIALAKLAEDSVEIAGLLLVDFGIAKRLGGGSRVVLRKSLSISQLSRSEFARVFARGHPGFQLFGVLAGEAVEHVCEGALASLSRGNILKEAQCAGWVLPCQASDGLKNGTFSPDTLRLGRKPGDSGVGILLQPCRKDRPELALAPSVAGTISMLKGLFRGRVRIGLSHG